MKKEIDLLELAWGLIANANEGNWDKATLEWKKAAGKWRDEYHKLLKENNVVDQLKKEIRIAEIVNKAKEEQRKHGKL